ncbi:hypothetical protein RhiJN_03252 [Ceratobasidium sp. AG-Ba]|nr:hypothetical protein RhiJN_03252 [Ceratobasidium sp. AG-Ba]
MTTSDFSQGIQTASSDQFLKFCGLSVVRLHTSGDIESSPGMLSAPSQPKTRSSSIPASQRLDNHKPPPPLITPPPKPPKSKVAFARETESTDIQASDPDGGTPKPVAPPPDPVRPPPSPPSHDSSGDKGLARREWGAGSTLPDASIRLGGLQVTGPRDSLPSANSGPKPINCTRKAIDEHIESVPVALQISCPLLSPALMSGNERKHHDPPPPPTTPPPKSPKAKSVNPCLDPSVLGEPVSEFGPERAPKPAPPPPHPDPVGPPPRPGKYNVQGGGKGVNEAPKVPPRPTTPPPPPPPRNGCELKGHEPPPPPPVAPPKPPKSASAQGMALDAEHVYALENAQPLLELLMHWTRRPPDICKPLAQAGSLRASANQWHGGGGTHMASVVA